MHGRATADRTHLWLPLLRRLTERFPRWAVWKNVGSALAGHGDVDSFAPPEDWSAILAEFRQWVTEERLGPVIVCGHIPQGPHFITLEERSPYLLQLDVKERATLRGCTLLDVPELLALAFVDDRGIRRIRPGAEGVIKLLINGMRRGGHPDDAALRAKGVVELLRQDPEGVQEIARLLGPSGPHLRRAVDALLLGGWDRRAMRTVELHAYARALREPRVALSRIWFNAVAKKRCPVIGVIRHQDRRIPDDRRAWLDEVAKSHAVTPHPA